MYSVVLMMAVAGSADVPAGLFHKGGNGCCGGYSSCNGCYGGGYYSSCTGSGYGSCTGYAVSYGCCGGGGHGHGHKSHGCCGGGGFFGGHKHGHKSHGCCGGYASSYGCCGGSAYYGTCTGGTYGTCTGSWGCTGGMAVPVTPAMPAMPAPTGEPVKKPKETKEEVSAPAPATIVVSLPEAAKLTIDDAATTSTSARRVFVSPALPIGKEFQYSLKAEYARDGKPVSVKKTVTVRAGEETAIDLTADLAGVASR